MGWSAMLLDLNSPESICAWYAINPKRHGPQLAQFAKLRPEFAAAISQAGNMLRLHSA